MKIMHLLATNSFSGAENVVCQIIDMYKNDKDLDMVYCSPNGKIKNKLVEKNIKFYPLNKLNYSSIKKAIMDFEPDIIHAHDIKATIYASLFSKKCKIISHVHGNSIDMRKTSLKSLLFLIVSVGVDTIGLPKHRASRAHIGVPSYIEVKSMILEFLIYTYGLVWKPKRKTLLFKLLLLIYSFSSSYIGPFPTIANFAVGTLPTTDKNIFKSLFGFFNFTNLPTKTASYFSSILNFLLL